MIKKAFLNNVYLQIAYVVASVRLTTTQIKHCAGHRPLQLL